MDNARRGCEMACNIGGVCHSGMVNAMRSRNLRQYRFFHTTGRLVVVVIYGLVLLLVIAPGSARCGSHDSAQVAWSYDTGG